MWDFVFWSICLKILKLKQAVIKINSCIFLCFSVRAISSCMYFGLIFFFFCFLLCWDFAFSICTYKWRPMSSHRKHATRHSLFPHTHNFYLLRLLISDNKSNENIIAFVFTFSFKKNYCFSDLFRWVILCKHTVSCDWKRHRWTRPYNCIHWMELYLYSLLIHRNSLGWSHKHNK